MLHDHLSEKYFTKFIYTQSSTDLCVYSKQTANGKVIIIIWVDDLIIATIDRDSLNNVKKMLSDKFKMKDLKHFLGIDLTQREEVRKNQTQYLTKILETFDMSDIFNDMYKNRHKLDSK